MTEEEVIATYRSSLAALHAEAPALAHIISVHTNVRGKPMDYSTRSDLIGFLEELDRPGRVVAQKCVQNGATEAVMAWLLYQVGWRGKIAAYFTPNNILRTRLVQSRVDPVMLRTPEYRRRMAGGDLGEEKGASGVRVKIFGRGQILFCSARTPVDALEFSADLLIVDEWDRCMAEGPETMALLQDRIREAPESLVLQFGNPTFPSVGICAAYSLSDRRRFHWRCDRCGEWQPLDWWQNVVRRDDAGFSVPRDVERWKDGGEIRPCCRRCTRPFERDPFAACWVAESASHVRGFHFSRLNLLHENFRSLVNEWREKERAGGRATAAFKRSVLGLGDAHGGQQLNEESLAVASVDPPLVGERDAAAFEPEIVTAGIDVGSVFHVTISVLRATSDEEEEETGVTYRRHSRWVGTVRHKKSLSDLLTRFHVNVACIDADPEGRIVRQLQQELGSRHVQLWSCRLGEIKVSDTQAEVPMRFKHDTRYVLVDRTALYDMTYHEIRNGICRFPRDVGQVPGWKDQMMTPQRVFDPVRERFIWISADSIEQARKRKKKPDHFYSSAAFDLAAFEVMTRAAVRTRTLRVLPPKEKAVGHAARRQRRDEETQ